MNAKAKVTGYIVLPIRKSGEVSKLGGYASNRSGAITIAARFASDPRHVAAKIRPIHS